ncbi:hypothetical protein L500_2660 [Bordetella holmesii CDC-H643-BH]|uniref:Uncharacterized protein n=2 Tax=Bordetella holmesii TaxID=35814 RepID=A0A158M3X9_9BORD|nr:hypothetical protein D556_0669 [Bordetella holmesii 41130]EXX95187.1 hypothetical protein D559_2618 [Bordetella holmesii 1058]KAK78216.1 hypothetical protein L503_2357 [Bordetella holmesii CDC-H809-BH]KAK87029.1 hypothetical protein L573_2506 [Bordetella holmesii H620]KAK87564.1 hypothetical protein L496_2319 [Bordetella holmesii CDC-H572-BH]KAK90609.1 hypothetical protein L497_2350 [Bordetella holmesii CDC-H585-BH]KCV01365.1 hypothetical protein L498_2540 [Bordetella holmesii CDC-H629-BH]
MYIYSSNFVICLVYCCRANRVSSFLHRAYSLPARPFPRL